ncbi:MAG: class I SAM-dependent methyltransferase [Bacteroidia bacterium]|nr:class I SAM-dependent methyltransferase [Bacteroidia bacterium]
MELATAISLIQTGIPNKAEVWADLGAGTGLFTRALLEILPEEGLVHALDKSPRYLYDLWRGYKNRLIVHDGDFIKEMELPKLDGIVMANALHYVREKRSVLNHILSYLKPKGTFILVEYDTDSPNPPWVPYPISRNSWKNLCKQVGLEEVEVLGQTPSRYGYQYIYSSSGIFCP